MAVELKGSALRILTYDLENNSPIMERCEVPPCDWTSQWPQRRRLSELTLTEQATHGGYRIVLVRLGPIVLFVGKADSIRFFAAIIDCNKTLMVTIERFERLVIPGQYKSGDEIIDDSCDTCGKRFKTKRRYKGGLCPDCSFEEANAGPAGSDHMCRICRVAIALETGPGLGLCFDCRKKSEEPQSKSEKTIDSCDVCGRRFQVTGEHRGICGRCAESCREAKSSVLERNCTRCGMLMVLDVGEEDEVCDRCRAIGGATE